MGKTKLASDELAILTERKDKIQSAKGSLSDLYTASKGFANAFERVLRDSDLKSSDVSVSSIGVITAAKDTKSAAGKSTKSKSDKAQKKLPKSNKVPAKKLKSSKPKKNKEPVVDADSTSNTVDDTFDSSSDAPEGTTGELST